MSIHYSTPELNIELRTLFSRKTKHREIKAPRKYIRADKKKSCRVQIPFVLWLMLFWWILLNQQYPEGLFNELSNKLPISIIDFGNNFWSKLNVGILKRHANLFERPYRQEKQLHVTPTCHERQLTFSIAAKVTIFFQRTHTLLVNHLWPVAFDA